MGRNGCLRMFSKGLMKSCVYGFFGVETVRNGTVDVIVKDRVTGTAHDALRFCEEVADIAQHTIGFFFVDVEERGCFAIQLGKRYAICVLVRSLT